ncbi:hypothetical protein WG907_03285 [Sphingobium sp. AN558]|uniref:hypothetical protein n=1 Tax=Sphingobium sp. AN558 TaxID=3133442 RepID=UPI0030BFC66A
MRYGSAAKTFRLLLGASIVVAGLAILMASLYSRFSGAPMSPAVIVLLVFAAGVMVTTAGARPSGRIGLADRIR